MADQLQYKKFTSTYCDGKHAICAQHIHNSLETLDQDYVNKYLIYISKKTNYPCISASIKNGAASLQYLIKLSSKFIINSNIFGYLSQFMLDAQCVTIMKLQLALNPQYISELIKDDKINSTTYGTLTIMQIFTAQKLHKLQSTKFIFNNINLTQLITFFPKIIHSLTPNLELLILECVHKNNSELDEYNFALIVTCIPAQTLLLKNIHKLLNNKISLKIRNQILNMIVGTQDTELILLLLQDGGIILDIEIVRIVISQKIGVGYAQRYHTNNATAEIIDLLCLYGLKITKEIVILMLKSSKYINNIETHGIKVDQDILTVCAQMNYYPYKYNIKPDINILIIVCSSSNTYEIIKIFKELGAEFNTTCLIQALKLKHNGKIIKYLLSVCNIVPNDECLRAFEETHSMEILELLIKNYSLKNPKTPVKKITNLELNKNCITVIEPTKIKINKTDKYTVRPKIKLFFELKHNIILYHQLYETVLKYLVDENLVIGNYFVINDKLSSLLNINSSSVVHIDNIDSLLTYFIKPIFNMDSDKIKLLDEKLDEKLL